MTNDKCHLQSHCGRYYDNDGKARCWCYNIESSRAHVAALHKEIDELEECIDALESTSGQLPTNNKTTQQ